MKTKLILTSFAIFLGFEIVMAQPPLPGPISISDSLRNEGNILVAIEECKKVFTQNPNDLENVYNYARFLSINRQIDSSFKYLNLAVQMNATIDALLEPDFLTIRKDKRWNEFENKLIAKSGIPIKDTAYASVLLKLRAYDQAYFLETGIAGRKLGFKSSVVEALWDLKFLISEMNQKELETWLDKKGWPRKSEVGSDAAFTAWLIIMHSNASLQHKYLPTIKKICEQNELPWVRYASIYDRCMFNEKKPQRYGTHSWYNEQTGKEEMYQLEDESKVNEWRREIGLDPLPMFSDSDAFDIFESIRNKDLNSIKSIVEKDQALVKRTDESGNSPLHQAVLAGSAPIVDYLLSHDADINAANTQGSTPLHLAIANRNDEMANYLINKGADLTRRDTHQNTPLHATVYTNRSEVARLLIEKGADIEAKGFMGLTPLGALTRSTHSFEVAEVLVNHGADVNVPWTDGDLPLNYAAMYSDNRVIDLLLDHHADFDTTGEHLVYTMLSVIEKGHVRFFNNIMEKCGDRLFADAEMNQHMMRTAISSNAIEIVRILQSKNIPLQLSAGYTGATPLHTIADNPEALVLAELLVKNGLDINARTNDGRSAYNIAETAGNKEMQDLLIKLGANTDPQKFPELTGLYLGQVPPANTPKRFAPGIVYADHSTISVSPDGNEIYWANGYSIMCSKFQNGHWTKPQMVSFSKINERMFYDDVPFVSPDNKRLFFTSKRPVDSLSRNSTKENIWFVERTADGWSTPKPVSPEVNALGLHWQVSVSGTGTLYFGGTDQFSLGSSDIYFSKLVDGKYTKPVNAGPVINSEEGESMPFIAPDESYLIFYRVVMQRPSLYISFRLKDGQWSQPQVIDKFQPRNCGIVTPDGKYFFMDSRWIAADFIEEMKPTEL